MFFDFQVRLFVNCAHSLVISLHRNVLLWWCYEFWVHQVLSLMKQTILWNTVHVLCSVVCHKKHYRTPPWHLKTLRDSPPPPPNTWKHYRTPPNIWKLYGTPPNIENITGPAPNTWKHYGTPPNIKKITGLPLTPENITRLLLTSQNITELLLTSENITGLPPNIWKHYKTSP